jgi:hypothetical protein
VTADRHQLEGALSQATSAVTTLKQQLTAAERLRKLLEGLLSAVDERPALALSLLEKDRVTVDEAADEELKRNLRALWASCAKRTEESVRDVTRTFPQELTDRGLVIDSGSRHPRYSVAQRLLEVELDTRKLVAVIRPRHGDAVREPLDSSAVAERVKAECSRLLDRPFDHKAFLKRLTAAHAVLAKPRKGEPVAAVMLRDLAAEMAKPAKPKLDEFAVDLGRLLAGEGGQSLQPSHTRDTNRGLLLYGLEQGGYVGSIDIRRTS